MHFSFHSLVQAHSFIHIFINKYGLYTPAAYLLYSIASLGAGAADNTRVALHFANAAKRVTMQPHVNEVVNQKALLRKLRDEVALLRKQLVSTFCIQLKHINEGVVVQCSCTCETECLQAPDYREVYRRGLTEAFVCSIRLPAAISACS